MQFYTQYGMYIGIAVSLIIVGLIIVVRKRG